MKTWKVAALSALVLMALMTWPFIRGYFGYGAEIPSNAPIGGEFELTRQDGRALALTDLQASEYWISFMEPKCQDCPAELRRVSELGLAGQVVVVSADPDLAADELGRWVNRFAPRAVAFSGDERELARVIGRYRLPAIPTEQGLEYPVRWYHADATGALIQLHPAGFSP